MKLIDVLRLVLVELATEGARLGIQDSHAFLSAFELEESDSMDDCFSIFAENFDHLEKEQTLKVMFKSLFADNLKRFDI